MNIFSDRRALPALLVSGFALFSAPASAQMVGLEDVIRATLTESPAVAREDERVRRAAGELQAASGAFDWNATAESGWERLYVPREENGFLTNRTREVDAWRTTVGLGKQFRNGITVQPGVTFYANTSSSAADALGLTRTRPALNVTVPLLRDYGEDNLASTAERAARFGLQAAEHGREHTTQDSLTNAVLIYWNCLAGQLQLDIAAADAAAADDFVATMREFVESGAGEPANLDRAVARQSVQRVALSTLSADAETCRRQLDIAMGGDGAGEPPMPVGEFPDMAGAANASTRLDADVLAETALMQREDYQALSLQNAAFSERVRGARDGTQPQLDVVLDPQRVLLRLSHSLGRNTQEGQLSQALAGEGESRINLRELENGIRLDIAARVRGIEDAVANWTALDASATAMQAVVDDARRRYETGIATQAELRDVEAEFAQVERQRIAVELQFASNLAALRLALGSIDSAAEPETIAGQYRTLP